MWRCLFVMELMLFSSTLNIPFLLLLALFSHARFKGRRDWGMILSTGSLEASVCVYTAFFLRIDVCVFYILHCLPPKKLNLVFLLCTVHTLQCVFGSIVTYLCLIDVHAKSHVLYELSGVETFSTFFFLLVREATSTVHSVTASLGFRIRLSLFLFGFHRRSEQINAACTHAEHITVGVQLWSESDDYWAGHDCPIMMGLGGLLNKTSNDVFS